MASQAQIIADTITGMKKAMKKRAFDFDSESDDGIEPITNRGNKLRKRARFVREGQLAPPNGLDVYKKSVVHAGFRRDIISCNPPVVDEDGFEIESEDDEERREDAIAAAAEFDPYTDVRLEHLLAPLTAASDLPSHPTLSQPFYSKQLSELTLHARNMLQKETKTLWRMRHLLTKLSGDHTWIPCQVLESENDLDFFTHGQSREARQNAASSSEGDVNADKSSDRADGPQDAAVELQSTTDVAMTDVSAALGVSSHGETPNEKAVPSMDENATSVDQAAASADAKAHQVESGEPLKVKEEGPQANDAGKAADKSKEGDDDEVSDAPSRMRTRAQAQAASDQSRSGGRSGTPGSVDDELSIHPYFVAPAAAHPDRDYGLPRQEAEEIRRIVQMYMQKQEEVCRGMQILYQNLLKAEQMRKAVLEWTKAEGHLDDMSDGEDWYDKDEWCLDGDLKKGQDEEEEEATTTQKKTRTRRQ